MKVYVVFCYDSVTDSLDKVFSSEEKAKEYVWKMDKISNFGWTYIKKEVE